MNKSSSNSGFYWVIGLYLVGIGGYVLYKKWYDKNIKDNPAFTFYDWLKS
jgi:uncharacterized protein YneF (UPF0154 family)